jgi:hypothetical protein
MKIQKISVAFWSLKFHNFLSHNMKAMAKDLKSQYCSYLPPHYKLNRVISGKNSLKIY